jgi:hypothetical protein
VKKSHFIFAIAFIAFLIACAPEADDVNPFTYTGPSGGNSSPGYGNPSSSSYVQQQPSSSSIYIPNTEEVTIAFGSPLSNVSSIFGTYVYGYTLVNYVNEDLTPFWNCEVEVQDAVSASACVNKTAQEANAVLQNTLTNQYAPLHYKVDRRVGTVYGAELIDYRLLVVGTQAALGINVSDEQKSIGEVGPTAIDNAVGFLYRYTGGAHEFRAAINENAFWFYHVPASPPDETVTIEIPFEGFMMGTRTTEMPFNLSKVTQFLWVVAYDILEPANNTGSLVISYFKALK